MGSRGLSDVQGFLLGSVTHKVIQLAPIAVLERPERLARQQATRHGSVAAIGSAGHPLQNAQQVRAIHGVLVPPRIHDAGTARQLEVVGREIDDRESVLLDRLDLFVEVQKFAG